MEASAVVEAPPESSSESYDGEAEATRSASELFRWCDYVHVGAGAEECEHATDGKCQDPEHFHAWVALANAFQARDITDKARAARARKIRSLRDPESDAGITLETELDNAWRTQRDALLSSIADRYVEKQLVEIVEALTHDERFENQQQDAEEYRRQLALPEEDRDKGDFERLSKDMEVYATEMQAEIDKAHERELTRLKSLGRDEVVALEREERIETIAREFYFHTYYSWTMFVGTLKPVESGRPAERVFQRPEDLHNAPMLAVSAIRAKIRELEEAPTVARSDAAGNL